MTSLGKQVGSVRLPNRKYRPACCNLEVKLMPTTTKYTVVVSERRIRKLRDRHEAVRQISTCNIPRSPINDVHFHFFFRGTFTSSANHDVEMTSKLGASIQFPSRSLEPGEKDTRIEAGRQGTSLSYGCCHPASW